jgi:ECF transporter S component (folate family)
MNIKKIAILGLMIAIEVVLERVLSIKTDVVKIGFGFIPVVLVALLYGPVYAGVTAAMADFIGVMLFPTGVYFPGFTLSAFIAGMIFGLLLYKKEKKLWRVISAALIHGLIVTLALGTLWLSILMSKGALVILPSRLLQFAILVPLQVILIPTFCQRLAGALERYK